MVLVTIMKTINDNERRVCIQILFDSHVTIVILGGS